MSEPRIPPSARALIALGEIMNRRPGPVPSIAELRARNADARLAPIFERADDEPSPAIEQLHAIVRELLARRPHCPIHGIPLDIVPPPLAETQGDGGAHWTRNVYMITVEWRCSHPDHTPETP